MFLAVKKKSVPPICISFAEPPVQSPELLECMTTANTDELKALGVEYKLFFLGTTS
jgi:hypothetical protein